MEYTTLLKLNESLDKQLDIIKKLLKEDLTVEAIEELQEIENRILKGKANLKNQLESKKPKGITLDEVEQIIDDSARFLDEI